MTPMTNRHQTIAHMNPHVGSTCHSFVKTLWSSHQHSLLPDGVGEYAPEDYPSDFLFHYTHRRDRQMSEGNREYTFCGAEGLAGD
jgi:hypothetical protein